MKKITHFGLIVLLSLLTLSLVGQVPQKINYQAVARNAEGLPIGNKQIAVKFTIRTGSSTGSEVFSERHTPWTNSLGTFSAIIGYGEPIYGTFATIDWATGSKWLQIGVDEQGGTNYIDMGTFEMLSVPYARLAQDVINKHDADADPTNELQNLSISGNQLTISSGNTVTLPDGGDNWGTQTVVTNATLAGDGTSANQLKIAQQGATTGQVLKWNGSTWAPAEDNAGSGGDNWGTQVVQTDATLSGEGTTANKLKLAQQSATSGQVLKWNGSTWAPAADNDTGDNWGTQTVSTDATLAGNGTSGNKLKLAQQSATSGQVLKWNGSTWAPAADNDTGDNWGTQTVQTDATLTGNGTSGNKLKLAQQSATTGQVLKWNGSTWAPADDNAGSSVTPGGNTDAIQYNSGGSFAGDNRFTYSAGDVYLNHANAYSSMNIDGGTSSGNNHGARINLNGRWRIYDVGADKHFKIEAIGSNIATPIVINHNTGRVDIGEISTTTNYYNVSKLRVDGGSDRAIMGGTNSNTYPAAFFRNTNLSGVALELENNSSSNPALVIQNKCNSYRTDVVLKKADGEAYCKIGSYHTSDPYGGYFTMIGTNQYFSINPKAFYSNKGIHVYAGESGSVGASLFYGYNPSGNQAYLEPEVNNKVQLGESGFRFKAVYATNGTIQTSDERDKSAIQDLNYGLQSVLKLRPISYQWKNEDIRMGTGRNLGFSAQELQKVIPDAVVAEKGKTPEDADHTYYGVKYAEIIPVLVKAIQELEHMLEQTTNEQQELKQIVKDQQKLIEKLSNK
jgi:hypothetical protein